MDAWVKWELDNLPDELPSSTLTLMLHLLNDGEFHASNVAWQLIGLIEDMLRHASPPQRGELLAAIEAGYGRFRDWEAPFQLTELLGTRYGDRAGLGCIKRLLNQRGTSHREFLAHALKHVALSAPDGAVANEAETLLTGFTRDSDPQVQEAAQLELAQLHRRRKK